METVRPDQPSRQRGKLACLRLLIGFLQSLALWGLLVIYPDKFWPGRSSWFFSALLMAGLFLPVLWISGVGLLDARQLRRWSCGAFALILVVAAVDVAGGAAAVTPENKTAFFIQTRFDKLLLNAGLILYIGHVMVFAGAREQRWIASGASYFFCAWKLGMQLMLSLFAFAVLCLPVGLFLGIWMGACGAWAAILVWAMGFAGAMHLADSGWPGKRALRPAQR